MTPHPAPCARRWLGLLLTTSETGTHPTQQLPDSEISEELIRRYDKRGPRYTSCPTADRFHGEFTEADYITYLAQRAADASKNPPLSIYIHGPFCESLRYFFACNKIITQDHSRTTE
jgi:oxygen-independent coproporphyrinogen-3 oxidase